MERKRPSAFFLFWLFALRSPPLFFLLPSCASFLGCSSLWFPFTTLFGLLFPPFFLFSLPFRSLCLLFSLASSIRPPYHYFLLFELLSVQVTNAERKSNADPTCFFFFLPIMFYDQRCYYSYRLYHDFLSGCFAVIFSGWFSGKCWNYFWGGETKKICLSTGFEPRTPCTQLHSINNCTTGANSLTCFFFSFFFLLFFRHSPFRPMRIA